MTLKELRKNANLRQIDVAKKLNLDQAAVSHWEGGVNPPSRKYWGRLAKIYHCTEQELAAAISAAKGEDA